METELQQAKAALRREMRAALQNIAPEARRAASAQLCARLKEQAFWQNAATVLFFAPLPDEADVWPLLEETVTGGKIAALPRFDPREGDYAACRIRNLRSEIVIGQFGIREPKAGCAEIALSRLDLILVPGLAFDLNGHRLGRGRGFYDGMLAQANGLKCGVALDEQITGTVPVGARDLPVDYILTPTRCVAAG